MKIFAYIYSDPLLEYSFDISTQNLDVDKLYHDMGERHQLETLLKDCQKNPPHYLGIRCLEELGDSWEEITKYWQQLTSLGILIILIESDDNREKLFKKKPLNIEINSSELQEKIQQNQYSLKLQKGQAINRIKALPPPGKAPYGYRRGKDRYIIDRSTSPVVKDFFEQFLLFGSLRGAVNYLEKRYGKKIAVSTGSRWLTNPVYRGDLAYQNNEIISDTHTPIISREEAAQIDRLLRRNRQLPSRTASAARSLAGLILCQNCQQPMTITQVTQRNKKETYLYIRPKNCPAKPQCKSIYYQDVLDKTIEYICQNFPQRVKNFNLNNLAIFKEEIQQKIQQKREIIEQINDLVTTEILDEQTAQIRQYKLKVEISQLRSKLEQLPPENLKNIADAVSLPRFWQDLSEAERRFYFREFIRQIQINQIDKNNWELEIIFIF
ncbi:recombinase family protein [Crocosphaera sp. XPORK-15E]|uniref:recombinase family protein n=1 Tax=Crocosphaera sp. XPORK-15E TaxID=3110247 RepID=UPI002B1EF827|nr:recombinase family protein [Crocosphaera sp. XPORK-15E]MEA5535449.1 recombinase family protein [Crocosphaera sp. XPORK-15E]